MRGFLALAVGVLLLLGACSVAPAATSGVGGKIAATLTDKEITLDSAAVSGGSMILSVRNSGTVVHSLVLLKTNLAHDKIPADPNDSSKADERGSVWSSGQLPVGQAKDFTLDLKAGKYVLICNEPAHYIVGMHTALTVNP